MDVPLLALVHSPLTGPSAWEPVAGPLRDRGFPVAVPRLQEALDAGPPYHPAVAASVGRRIAEAGAGREVVLVAHSGAGALLPAVADAVPLVRGAVFVDALLPHPGSTWFESVPSATRERLLALAEGDRLPEWSDWFPPEAMAELLPEAERRRRFIAELPRAPLAYFREAAPDPGTWPPEHCFYLRLSEAYREAAAEAERRGRPVRVLDGDHLTIMTDPGPVAELLAEFIAERWEGR